jgi:hypothetical protein
MLILVADLLRNRLVVCRGGVGPAIRVVAATGSDIAVSGRSWLRHSIDRPFRGGKGRLRRKLVAQITLNAA